MPSSRVPGCNRSRPPRSFISRTEIHVRDGRMWHEFWDDFRDSQITRHTLSPLHAHGGPEVAIPWRWLQSSFESYTRQSRPSNRPDSKEMGRCRCAA